MKSVLIVFPTPWDKKQLDACSAAWSGRYQVRFSQPTDEDRPWDFDGLAFIDRTVESCRGAIDGVLSASDYPGAAVAAAIAAQLGLPGPAPQTVLRCSHKYYSRLAQRAAVPEATPDFSLVDPRDLGAGAPAIGFPCFIKPVKGAFSILSRRLESAAQLAAFLSRPAVRDFAEHSVHLFNQLVRRFTDFEIDGGYFIAEELLQGQQVTVEGYSVASEVVIFGIVDSILHPEHGSFVRFDYPSRVAAEVQERMAVIARRAVRHLGLSNSLFNIEMIYHPPTDRIHIIEINPRISGQFGDLYQKVDGTNSYEIALALACGEPPALQRRVGSCRAAASLPLRIFEPMRVVRAPDPSDLAAAEAMFPGTLIWNECRAGLELTDFERIEDGHSVRYGIINAGAPTPESLLARLEQVRARLGFELQKISV